MTKQLPTGVARILDMRLQVLKYDVLSALPQFEHHVQYAIAL